MRSAAAASCSASGPGMPVARHTRSGCPRTTSTAASRRRSRSSFRCCDRVARTSRAPSMPPAISNSDRVGPRPGRIPIMIGAKGPKMLRSPRSHADIWSWYVQERSDLVEFGPRLAALEAACVEVGRDPATIGKSAGIVVEPTVVQRFGGGLWPSRPRHRRGDRRRAARVRRRGLHEPRAGRLAADDGGARRAGTGHRDARRRLIATG